jgi:hypothetical protein
MSDSDFRKEALELAIKEIEAHKESSLVEGHTQKLIESAQAIAEYIKGVSHGQ